MMITHRLEYIEESQKIFVMESGDVEASVTLSLKTSVPMRAGFAGQSLYLPETASNKGHKGSCMCWG